MKAYLLILFTLLTSLLYAQEPDIDSLKADALNETSDTARLRKLDILTDKLWDWCDDVDTMEKYVDMALALSKELNDKVMESKMYRVMGWEYLYQYMFKQAQECFFKGLEINTTVTKDSTEIGKSLRDLGIFFVEANDYNSATLYLHKALDIASGLKDSSTLSSIYDDYGLINYNMEQYALAIENNRKALEYATTREDSVLEIWNIADDESKLSHGDYAAVLRQEEAYIDYTATCMDIESYISDLFEDMVTAYWKLDSADSRRDTLLRKMERWKPVLEAKSSGWNEQIVASTLLQYYILKDDRPNADRLAEYLSTEGDTTLLDEYCKSLISYYNYTHDWRRVIEYTEKLSRFMSTKLNVEYSVNIEKSVADQTFREKWHDEDLKKRERDAVFEQQMLYNRIANICLGILGALALTLILYIAVNYTVVSRQQKQLDRQTEEIVSYNSELNTQQQEILSQKDEIERQSQDISTQLAMVKKLHKSLSQSVNYAQVIQRAVVPKEEDVKAVFPESFVLWRPRDVVSGDFYWIYMTENWRYLVTADCTGHGVPGALVSMLGTSVLNAISHQMDSMSVGEILDVLRAKVVEALTKRDSNVDDGMDMAIYRITNYGNTDGTDWTDIFRTQIYADSADSRGFLEEHGEHRITQNYTDNSELPEEAIKNQKLKIKNVNVEFSGANRPLIILRNGEVTKVKPDQMSVCVDRYGFWDGNFTTKTIELEEGDMLYTYSDGLEDQFGGRSGEKKFGHRRLYELLASVSALPVEAQREQIDAALTEWASTCHLSPETHQIDDQLIIGVKIK